ncbi:hypothetical protein ROZALSC1DRAFT_26008 [Rozella allomycis CSF55]|uniref:Uncharacterized protein n=1 Tax=Rozella allomycis (strain CSF55) TaxID=988480 RepID=A0A4P9YA96_ROZAC|nr:hypothetical protein ROZALSC1DRAFT_26008 [Rozella allomycis CSF55]
MRIVSELGISATHRLLFQLVVFENMLDCDKKCADRVKVWIVGYLNLLNELCRSDIPNTRDGNVGLFIVDEAHVLAATMAGRFVGSMVLFHLFLQDLMLGLVATLTGSSHILSLLGDIEGNQHAVVSLNRSSTQRDH